MIVPSRAAVMDAKPLCLLFLIGGTKSASKEVTPSKFRSHRRSMRPSVRDDQQVLSAITELLEWQGYEVVTAARGEAAVAQS
jgi:hypothetical protein